MVWWKEKPQLFEEVKSDLLHFPDLKILNINDKIFIVGKWAVYGKNHHIFDYNIKIEFPDDYPISIPKVFEVDDAIEKISARHFNSKESGNDACLFSPSERWEQWPLGASFASFLNGPVKAFFFSQKYFDLKGEWPFGEWRHGTLGVIEYYAVRLNVNIKNISAIQKFLLLMLSPKFYRQWKCPCNMKNRLIKCHGPQLIKLQNILPPDEIQKTIDLIKDNKEKIIRELFN